MSTTRQLRDEDGYHQLREAIVRGELAPNQRLIEATEDLKRIKATD